MHLSTPQHHTYHRLLNTCVHKATHWTSVFFKSVFTVLTCIFLLSLYPVCIPFMFLSVHIWRISCARWSRSSCACAARSWPSNPSPPSAHTMFARYLVPTGVACICNHSKKQHLFFLCMNFSCCSPSLLRLVFSGRSERRCTPAPPAVTTWAKTTSWPKTRRSRCCSTSSFPAIARADEVEIPFLRRIHTRT